MIKKVEQLGHAVEVSWRRTRYSQNAFSRIAFEELRKSRLHEAFSMADFLRCLRRARTIPRQLSLDNGFGHPPITLYRNDRLNFLIDIYFWVTPDLAIHSHGFQGAFTVLHGTSLQCRFRFPVRKNLQDKILIGTLLPTEMRFLKKGDVREIPPGRRFIHQVWHLGYPTVSLVIRTAEWKTHQFTYLKPHLAYRYRAFTPLERKQLDTLLMLHRIRSPLEQPFLEGLVKDAAPHESLAYLKHYHEETGDVACVRKALGKIPGQKWGRYFLESLKDQKKTLVDWPALRGETERCLLALLRTATGKEEIIAGMQRLLPNDSPHRAIRKCIKRMMQQKILPFRLNETALDILEGSLRSRNNGESLSGTLAKRYGVRHTQAFQKEIRTFRDRLRAVPLLRPLLISCLPRKSDERS